MTEHTPGPWHHNSGQIYPMGTGRTLALIPYYDGSQIADVRLLTASPELYAALEALTDWARDHTSPRDANSPHELIKDAVAALILAREG